MRYSECSGPECGELSAVGLEGCSSDLVCLLGLRRHSGTRLSLLDASSVTQRPSEKLEAPGPHRTDVDLQAFLPEINTGANQDSGMLLCGREEMLISVLEKIGGGAGKGEEVCNLLGQRGSEGLVIEEVGLDLEQQSSHFGRRLGEGGTDGTWNQNQEEEDCRRKLDQICQ